MTDEVTNDNPVDEEDRNGTSNKLRWPVKSDVPLLHANFFAVMKTNIEAVLTFREYLPYIQDRDDERTMEQLENSSINIVARIAMSPAGFDSLVSMLKNIVNGELPSE